MDKFAALKAFVSVAERGGFAAAARERGQSRSAVNRFVIALEDELGAQLFNRTTRQVSLTAEGVAFYERAVFILSVLEDAERDVGASRHESAGQLRVNAPMSFGTLHLGTAVAEFMSGHPKLRIELHLNDRIVDVIEEGFDLAIRIAEPREDTTLVDLRICDVGRVICASPDYLRAHGPPAHPRELKTRRCLHYGNLPSGNLWRLTGPGGNVSVHVNNVLCSNNGEVLRDAAVRGIGITMVPGFIVEQELRTGRLVTILDDFHAPQLVLTAIYPPTRYLSAKIRLFTDFLIARFGNSSSWNHVR